MAVSPTMSEYNFKIKYDGPALKTGRMSAREAGEAIIAAGNLLERVSDLTLPGKRQQVTLEVDSKFRRGSFEILFHLVPWTDTAISAISIEDLERIVSIVFGSGGLIALYKMIRGRPTTVERRGDGITINAGGTRATVNNHVYNLLVDPAAAENLRDMIKPLRRPGVTSLEAKADRKRLAVVKEEEAKYFGEALKPDEEVHASRRRVNLNVLQVDFQRGHKWMFSKEAEQPFYALIEDERFWLNVGSGEPFSAGDTLLVDLETTTILRPFRAPEITHRITRVHAHTVVSKDQIEHDV